MGDNGEVLEFENAGAHTDISKSCYLESCKSHTVPEERKDSARIHKSREMVRGVEIFA